MTTILKNPCPNLEVEVRDLGPSSHTDEKATDVPRSPHSGNEFSSIDLSTANVALTLSA
jgi:hypothetical protein